MKASSAALFYPRSPPSINRDPHQPRNTPHSLPVTYTPSQAILQSPISLLTCQTATSATHPYDRPSSVHSEPPSSDSRFSHTPVHPKHTSFCVAWKLPSGSHGNSRVLCGTWDMAWEALLRDPIPPWSSVHISWVKGLMKILHLMLLWRKMELLVVGVLWDCQISASKAANIWNHSKLRHAMEFISTSRHFWDTEKANWTRRLFRSPKLMRHSLRARYTMKHTSCGLRRVRIRGVAGFRVGIVRHYFDMKLLGKNLRLTNIIVYLFKKNLPGACILRHLWSRD